MSFRKNGDSQGINRNRNQIKKKTTNDKNTKFKGESRNQIQLNKANLVYCMKKKNF